MNGKNLKQHRNDRTGANKDAYNVLFLLDGNVCYDRMYCTCASMMTMNECTTWRVFRMEYYSTIPLPFSVYRPQSQVK